MSTSSTAGFDQLYSLRDTAADYYGPVLAFRSDAQAVRSIASFLFASPDSDPAKFPESFFLFHVGCFDSSSGTLVPASPRLVISCVNALQIADRLRGGAVGGGTPPEDKAQPAAPDGSGIQDTQTTDLFEPVPVSSTSPAFNSKGE